MHEKKPMSVRSEVMDSLGEIGRRKGDKRKKIFDEVIYHESIDILGKRVIDKEKNSEIVHRIMIDEKSIHTSLESVDTDFVKIDYYI